MAGKAEEEFWRGHVLGWRQAGVSRAAYCRGHGLEPQAFHKWVTQLRDEVLRVPPGRRRRRRSQRCEGEQCGPEMAADSGAVDFVPLVLAADDAGCAPADAAAGAEEAGDAPGQVDVLLGGAVVRIHGAVDEALLRRVLTAVRATA